MSKKLCKDPLKRDVVDFQDDYIRVFNNKFTSIQCEINNLNYQRKYMLRYKKRILTDYYFIFKDILINSSQFFTFKPIGFSHKTLVPFKRDNFVC